MRSSTPGEMRPVDARQSRSSGVPRLEPGRDRRGDRTGLGHPPGLEDADAEALLEALHQRARTAAPPHMTVRSDEKSTSWSLARSAGDRPRWSAPRHADGGRSLAMNVPAARPGGTGPASRGRRRPATPRTAAPGVGVEHRDDRAATRSFSGVRHHRAVCDRRSSAGTWSGESRRHPSDCRWCRSCNTSPPRRARRPPGTRYRGCSAASSSS